MEVGPDPGPLGAPCFLLFLLRSPLPQQSIQFVDSGSEFYNCKHQLARFVLYVGVATNYSLAVAGIVAGISAASFDVQCARPRVQADILAFRRLTPCDLRSAAAAF